MINFIILGSGQLANFIFKMSLYDKNTNCLGFIKKNHKDNEIPDLKCLGLEDSLNIVDRDISIFPAVGDLFKRKLLINKTKSLGFKITQLVHPSSFVCKSSTINNSSLTYNSFVSNNVNIGEDSILGTGSYVHHNTIIGKNCLIGGGTHIGASVIVGDNVLFGIGSIVASKKITIGSNCVIGSGAVVLDNIEDNSTVVGNPARKINLS